MGTYSGLSFVHCAYVCASRVVLSGKMMRGCVSPSMQIKHCGLAAIGLPKITALSACVVDVVADRMKLTVLAGTGQQSISSAVADIAKPEICNHCCAVTVER